MGFSQPAPGAWPDGLILFDGVCAFCSRWVAAVIAHDPERRFSFVSIQSPQGRELARQCGVDPEAPETNAVIDGGRAYFKSDAALVILSRLDGFGWTKVLRAIPRPARDWLYDRMARNRYAMFGKLDACMVPKPEDRARFLDHPAPAEG